MANDIAATTDRSPVVETSHGRLRGALDAGIRSFKGVPYGAPTAGRNRFRPPAPPPPWRGVRDALEYQARAW